jgi:8-hydroxy-5-deazaflavin:NADPH oxidoreductase
MKISILGGTGHYGKGLAFRWAKKHLVMIGSRDEAKARHTADQFNAELGPFSIPNRIAGASNLEAVKFAEVVVLTLRFPHLIPVLNETNPLFASKTVLSPVVPLVKKECFQYPAPPEGSAALAIRALLPPSAKIVAGLHTIPAAGLRNLHHKLEGDAVYCGDEEESKKTVRGLIQEIESLRPLDAGPLQISKMIEPLVPLLLNIKLFDLKKDLTVKFI